MRHFGVLLSIGTGCSQLLSSPQFQTWQSTPTFATSQSFSFQPQAQFQTQSFQTSFPGQVSFPGSTLRVPSQSFATTSFPSQGFASQGFASQGFASQASANSVSPGPQSIADIQRAIDTLYDQSQFQRFNLVITPSNLALMKQDPKRELKVHCQVTADYNTPQAQTYSNPNMGCGYKGSVGSLRLCFDQSGQFVPSNCRKPSIKVDVEYFGPGTDGRVDGVKRLLFHGMPADWSLMAERISFYFLKLWGIAAPLSTHANLYLNGQNLGVHSFVQAIDDFFTQEHFGNDYNRGKGGLYKELWFNPVNMAGNITKALKYGKNEDAFMRQVMAAIQAAPLTVDGANQVFNTYFDPQSIIDVTAANTVLGDTDDWRQRHNFFWYVRQDASGKKLVLIPWDYDRLNDAGAATRGALKGRPWWQAPNPSECSAPLVPAPVKGSQQAAGNPSQAAYWTDIFQQLPPDLDIPVSCDKITQLMALALGSQIRQRTREFAATVNAGTIDSNFAAWDAQIQAALAQDPDGPSYSTMLQQQQALKQFILQSAQSAASEATQGDSGLTIAGPGQTILPAGLRPQVGQLISTTFIPAPGVDLSRFNIPGATTQASFPAFASPSAFAAPGQLRGTPSFPSFAQPVAFNSFPAPSSQFASFPAFSPFAG